MTVTVPVISTITYRHGGHTRELPSLCTCVHCESLCDAASVSSSSSSSSGVSYPFIMREGSSVSTQAAELTKRFSGGRAVLFPATVLETIVITLVHNSNSPHIMVQ